MAAKIQKDLNIQAQLVAGSGGVFDVKVDNTLIFSKAATGTFPDEDMIINLLKK